MGDDSREVESAVGADGEYSISSWIVMLISLYHQVDVLRNSHLLIA